MLKIQKLQNAKELTMKKKTLTLVTVFAVMWILQACGESKADILADFQELMAKPVSSDNALEASMFLDEKTDDVDKDTAEQMVSLYHDYLYSYILAQKDKTRLKEMAVYIDKDTGLVDEDKIRGSSHGEYYEKIKAAGMTLCNCEEDLTLNIDYGNLLERFRAYIPQSMIDFYELEETINLKPATKNATLMISWQELLERALRAEQIITAFPEDKIIRQDVQWLYKKYLSTILMGTTNTPLFDYGDKEFSREALKAYQNFVKEEPETVLAWVLEEYLKYMDGIEYKLDFNDASLGKAFFANCDWLISEGEKRLNKQ